MAGAVTATVGLSVLVLGIVRTDVVGWGSTEALGLIAGGAALLLVFLTIEGRLASAPLMPLRIYSSRTLSAANTIIFLTGAATFGMWFFVSLYVQQVLDYTPIKAGLAFLPMTLCIVAGSVFVSRTVPRFGARRLLVVGMLAQVAGLLLFTEISPTGNYLSDMLAPSLLVAIGIGLSFVPASICAVAGVAPGEAGLASGLVNTSRLVGGALGLAILAALATARTNHDLHHAGAGVRALHSALVDGFQLAFVVAAAFALVGAAVALVGIPKLIARPAEAGVAPRVAPAESAS
jgi:predicted MFS family arabinose efflux permease